MDKPNQREGNGFEPLPWTPGNFAVRAERRVDPDGAQPTMLLLQHPVDPFVARIDDATDASLRRAAFAYLEAAAQLAAVSEWPEFLPAEWTEGLRPRPVGSFGWMPVERQPGDAGAVPVQEPFGSFRVGPLGGDHVVALFASERLGNTAQFLGSGFGLRVVLRLRSLGGGRFEASINGLSAALPFGDYRRHAVPKETWGIETYVTTLRNLLISEDLRADLGRAAGLDKATLGLRGVRLAQLPDGRQQLELRGIGRPGGGEAYERVPHAFTVLRIGKGPDILLNRAVMVADCAPDEARVFVRDPASQAPAKLLRQRRPTRKEAALDIYRTCEQIDDPLTDGLMKVLPCPRFVRADRTKVAANPRSIPLPGNGPPVRSDDASAGQGFRHLRELMQRLAAYGLPPLTYFRTARADIDVYFRSGISPGPGKDGQTVNARVLPEGWPPNVVRLPNTPPSPPPKLQLHLGLANLSHRARCPWVPYGQRSPAEPLGIGADARWMWHEFGHVLLMATTGELELRFAHSPGDALAAIVADPESQLAADSPRWRYATFPWVFLPRRHDRCVHNGWSWGGALHAALARVPDVKQPRRKGYRSEQILSTTLFRMYRCLGGDTALIDPVKALEERRRASHYSVYLIMRALQLLGDARVLPALGPNHLEQALELADTDTTTWSATFPIGSAQTYSRTGGCAQKAIRWAFEAQGLYTAAGANGNAPGAPPPVDVYIASRRPNVDAASHDRVNYGPGNYLPASLHWQAGSQSAAPLWQADEQAIRGRRNDTIEVEVGNRGQQPASGVEVTVWWAHWPSGDPAPPKWPDSGSWTACTPLLTPPQDIAAGRLATFGPFDAAWPAGRYVVFAQATCAGDQANTAKTNLACTRFATPIIDIVANDNNLGLRVFG